MTTTQNTTINLVQPHEAETPKLGFAERASLLLALNTVLLEQGEVTVSLTYEKQTDAKPRVAGKDYVAMPGVDPHAFFGRLTSVSRRKADGRVYFNVESLSRGDGTTPAKPTSLIPAGITSFVVTGCKPSKQGVPAPQPQSGATEGDDTDA